MARLKLSDDSVAQLCYKYLHGGCGKATNKKIYKAVHDVVSQKDATMYVFEIAHAIGYAKSALQDSVSETTYKKKKKAIRENILNIIRSENERT